MLSSGSSARDAGHEPHRAVSDELESGTTGELRSEGRNGELPMRHGATEVTVPSHGC